MANTLLALASTLALGLLPRGAAAAGNAQGAERAIELRPGQAVVFPVAIVDGGVVVGVARAAKPGAVPEEGEIAVQVLKQGASPYAELTASEKTEAPVDFVADGLVGDIRLDERVVCGRLDAPAKSRIYSGSWRISLNRFMVHKESQDCR